jgi:hypothetical protein
MGDYVDAVREIQKGAISSRTCRAFGMNFSLEKVAPMYEKYFSDILDVYTGAGWYADGNGINAMTKLLKPL